MKDTQYSTIAMRTLLIILAVTLMPVLSSTMQAKAPTYQNTYKPLYTQSTYRAATTTTAPSATFQSTSAYSEQWEMEKNACINEDGTVNEHRYLQGPRPRRIGSPDDEDEPDEGEGGGSNNSGEGGDNNWNGSELPLGEGLWALLILAMGYLVLRKRRAARP